MAQLPKGGLVRGYDKPIHGSCATYFPGSILPFIYHLYWGDGNQHLQPTTQSTSTNANQESLALSLVEFQLQVLSMRLGVAFYSISREQDRFPFLIRGDF